MFHEFRVHSVNLECFFNLSRDMNEKFLKTHKKVIKCWKVTKILMSCHENMMENHGLFEKA